MSRWALFAVSFAAHLGIALGLGRIERPLARAATAISISETPKKKQEPPKPPDEPPPREKEPVQRAAQRAKAAPVEAKAEPQAAPRPSPNPSSGDAALDALPDFGVSLSGGSGGPGLAVPAGQPGGTSRRAPVEKVVKRLQALTTKEDACDEPVVKPKPKSVPTPVYTEAGRAAGIEGKVRVEVTVDDQGRVVSVRVLQGLGHGLDEAALEAARQASFEPATRCGKPVAATFNIGMRFSI